jgi:tetratricopeptide (TPR) repeat protein
MEAMEKLEREVASGGDARAHYRLAVLLIASRDLYEFDTPDDTGVLRRAEELLARSIQQEPRNAAAYAALGFAQHQLGRAEDALASFRKSRSFDRTNATVDVYVPTLLVELGREAEALSDLKGVARRRKVSLAGIRKELLKIGPAAGAADLLFSGFIRARNYLWSELADEAERIRNTLERGRRKRLHDAEERQCREHQADLIAAFRLARVPRKLRRLARAASRYGVGDDFCRPRLMQEIPKRELRRLIRDADKLAGAVDEWLNGFPEGKMSVEAAAFLYLMSGIEEAR